MKKTVLLLIIAVLFYTASAETLYCVSVPGCAALIARDGTAMIGQGRFDSLIELIPGSRYAAGTSSEYRTRYALVDEHGQPLTEAEYDMLHVSDDHVIFRRDDLFGAMDLNGTEIIEARYTALVSNGEDGFLAVETDIYDAEPDMVIHLAADGTRTECDVYTADSLRPFSEGLCVYRDTEFGRYGYLKADGTVVIPPVFEYAGDFELGRAVVYADGGFGVIDTRGEWTIAPDYGYMTDANGIIAALTDDGTMCAVFDRKTDDMLFSVATAFANIELMTGGDEPMLMVTEGTERTIYAMTGEKRYTVSEQMRGDTDGAFNIIVSDVMRVGISAGCGTDLIVSDGTFGSKCTAVITKDGRRSGRYVQVLPLEGSYYIYAELPTEAYRSDILGEDRYSYSPYDMRFGMMDASCEILTDASYTQVIAADTDRFWLIENETVVLADDKAAVLWHSETEILE